MDTMNIALSASMKAFVQGQVSKGDYSSTSEYIRSLIREDQRKEAQAALQAEIIQGLTSGESAPMTREQWILSYQRSMIRMAGCGIMLH